jgi:hypothetical protein
VTVWSEYRGSLDSVRHFAAWAARLRGEREAIRGDAGVLKHLVDAARRQGAQAIQEFHEAVRRSALVFGSLGEPLAVLDFTQHRWVAGHREEAYSDWLQWILAQAEPAEVLRIFGVRDPKVFSACAGCTVTVEREPRVCYGDEGRTGRLDLEIRLGDVALLVVEVKLGEAEYADTGKQADYRAALEDEKPTPLLVILVVDAADEEYYGFKPRLWADACIELRLAAVRSCGRQEHLRAAMILAFVAAVEQNLLGFQGVGREFQHEVAASLVLPRATEHLSRFLEAINNGEKNRA